MLYPSTCRRLPRATAHLRDDTRKRRRSITGRSFIAFVLIACFGILFAGCSRSSSDQEGMSEEFVFTEEDVARMRELVMKSGTGEEVMGPSSGPTLLQTEPTADVPVFDLSMATTYDAIRMGPQESGKNVFSVTNEFLNVRSSPSVTASQVDRVERGVPLTVVDFHDAAWAKVQLGDGREGYVATRYIAKKTSEERLLEEKKAYGGLYFVNFGFLNVRKDPNAQSEKLGELPGQALVRPLSMDAVWARVPFEGREGYVAVEYLQPFLPNFLVRQWSYTLPILHYRLSQEGMEDALVKHIAELQSGGAHIITLRDLRELLLAQEQRDVRLDPKSVVLALSNITAANIDTVSGVLRASGVQASMFVRTADIGIDGITDKDLITLTANGHDVQSAGHTGDDLRSLTNAQVELELKQSRRILEQKTGKPVFAILYPLGGVNERVSVIAREAGYLFGVGSTPVRTFTRDELLMLPSYPVTPTMTEADILQIAVGREE